MKKLLWSVIATLVLSQNALAGVNTIEVQIESVGIIATAFGGHQAGNMEIKIKNGFQLPSGVYCDTSYITTKKKIDSDRAMFSLLRDAKVSGGTVQLIITDDKAHSAYSGRCSLLAAVLL